jgi:hypothetical protein
MTGSQMAEWLAQCGVGHLRFIDHDTLEVENLARHTLDENYLGQNKAKGMAAYLAKVPGLDVQAIPREIDRSISDDLLDRWLSDADLIIAATDRQDVQRRVGRSALRLGVEALFPALYVEGGGEIIVQFDVQLPCFSCWDNFRSPDRPLRGPSLLPHTALPVIYAGLRLSLGLLDRRSTDREMFTTASGQPPFQVFTLNSLGALDSAQLERDRSCPACGGGPSPPQTTLLSFQPRMVTRPSPAIPTRPTSRPSAESPSVGKPGIAGELFGRLALFVVSLAFFAAPFGVMSFVAPEANAHPNEIIFDVISLVCFGWFIAGAIGVFRALRNLFTGNF